MPDSEARDEPIRRKAREPGCDIQVRLRFWSSRNSNTLIQESHDGEQFLAQKTKDSFIEKHNKNVIGKNFSIVQYTN